MENHHIWWRRAKLQGHSSLIVFDTKFPQNLQYQKTLSLIIAEKCIFWQSDDVLLKSIL